MQETTLYSAENMVIIRKAYRKMLRSVKAELDKADKKNIRIAYELASKAHSKQYRKSGEPYILHPIAVAQICAEEIGLGATAIVSALLHDVVEDTEVTLEEIEAAFGTSVMKIVDGLTKLDNLYATISPQAENFKKVLSTLATDVRIVLIKMADRLHNMRTIGSMPPHKQLKIAGETSHVYSPLAHRLGLYNIKSEFQDLCMKVMDPDTFFDIAQKLQESKDSRNNYIKEFIKPLKSKFDLLNYPYRITGRPKSIYSIANKIQKKGVAFEEIYDLFAIRIILDVPVKKEKQVCWQVYSIVTDVHTPIPERLKDWITTPKANGYESLHTTVIGPMGRFVEVQIRAERMDEIAERGFAAHWKYKMNTPQPNIFDNWLNTIRELIESPDSDAIEFLDDFSANLFSEGVHVFTPKGDMMVLPKDATALDFAFSIHSDVGYHCKSIKVNNKLEPLNYKLQNGDQIQINTDRNQKPNEGWLKMVVTGKARSKIRSSMKEEKKKAGEVGREALERKFKSKKVDFEQNVDMLVKHFGLNSRVELYYDISIDKINLKEVGKFSVENGKLVKPTKEAKETPPKKQATPTTKITPRGNSSARLRIEGEAASQYEYSLAKCCNPVQGDDVFGYLTATAGLKIHRTNCPNATRLAARYGYRIMKAQWESTSNTDFIAELVITGIDDGPGVIERLMNNISSGQGLNIRSFSIDGNEGKFEGRMKLFVTDKNQLNLAIAALKKLSGVINVTRLK